LWFF